MNNFQKNNIIFFLIIGKNYNKKLQKVEPMNTKPIKEICDKCYKTFLAFYFSTATISIMTLSITTISITITNVKRYAA
jgi:hypothetical protein